MSGLLMRDVYHKERAGYSEAEERSAMSRIRVEFSNPKFQTEAINWQDGYADARGGRSGGGFAWIGHLHVHEVR